MLFPPCGITGNEALGTVVPSGAKVAVRPVIVHAEISLETSELLSSTYSLNRIVLLFSPSQFCWLAPNRHK